MADISKQLQTVFEQVRCLREEVNALRDCCAIIPTLQEVTEAGNTTDKTIIVDQGFSQGIYHSSVAAIYDSAAKKGSGLIINGLKFQNNGSVTNVNHVDHGDIVTPIEIYFPAMSGTLALVSDVESLNLQQVTDAGNSTTNSINITDPNNINRATQVGIDNIHVSDTGTGNTIAMSNVQFTLIKNNTVTFLAPQETTASASLLLPKVSGTMIVDAPADTKQYARQDNAWSEIAGGGQTLYDAVYNTEAEIFALDPQLYGGKTFWAVDTKSAFKSVIVDTSLIWQNLTTKFDGNTQTYYLPTTQDGQTQNLGQELFSSAVNTEATPVTAIAPKVFLMLADSLAFPGHVEANLIDSGGLYVGARYGVNTTDGAAGGTMKVTTYGLLRGINTSAWASGDVLFVSDAVPGTVTNVKPTINAFAIGQVQISDAVNGTVFINTTAAIDLVVNTEIFSGTPYYFSGDISSVDGTSLSVLGNTKGTLSANITAVVDDNQIVEGSNRLILNPLLTADSQVSKGVYQGKLQISNSTSQASERVYVEIYKASAAGVPIDVAPDGELGSLGINAIVIHSSTVLNLAANDMTNVSISAELLTDIPVLAGETFLYVPLFEKLGTAGSAKTFTMLTGPTGDTYIQGLGTNAANLVPYTGATKTVNLGNQFVKTTAVPALPEDLVNKAYGDANYGSGGLYKDRMVPNTVVEYYGTLINFDGNGVGIGSWAEIYLCNGANGTPDKRGRAGVGVTTVQGGGAFSPETDPTLPGNPNYTLNMVVGSNTEVLTEAQLPAHTHAATVIVNDSGHTHSVPVSGQDGSGGTNIDGSDQGASPYNTSSAITGITVDVTNALAGNGETHNNIQPSLGCHYIMYIPA